MDWNEAGRVDGGEVSAGRTDGGGVSAGTGCEKKILRRPV